MISLTNDLLRAFIRIMIYNFMLEKKNTHLPKNSNSQVNTDNEVARRARRPRCLHRRRLRMVGFREFLKILLK